jgi:magnesium transporter
MRKKVIRTHHKKIGASPGTLVHVGDRKVETVKISVFEYDAEHLTEKIPRRMEDCASCGTGPQVCWVDITGIHQVDILEKCGAIFGLHPLVLEDILNTGHRPKYEEHDDFLFLVLKMLNLPENGSEIRIEQVSLIVGRNHLLTFQEQEGDLFDGVRERLRGNRGKIRKHGADYLAYALIDAIVDGHFVILEKIGDKIEKLEDELLSRPSPETLHQIHNLKREMILLRKSVWPLRELIGRLQRAESPLIAENTGIFLRDVYDHTIQIIDTVETFRDMLAGMLDLYLSSISNRMNEIMKVLTIIATIFIPLTFFAGVYGMNFDYLPELRWRWGYAAFWGLSIVCALGMVRFFRGKKWL